MDIPIEEVAQAFGRNLKSSRGRSSAVGSRPAETVRSAGGREVK
jgi:hypothetical protein